MSTVVFATKQILKSAKYSRVNSVVGKQEQSFVHQKQSSIALRSSTGTGRNGRFPWDVLPLLLLLLKRHKLANDINVWLGLECRSPL